MFLHFLMVVDHIGSMFLHFLMVVHWYIPRSWSVLDPMSATGTVLVGITKKSRTQMRECFHRHYVRKLCTWHVLG